MAWPTREAVPLRSPLARGALLALAILWSVAGWWIVVQGALSLSPDRRSVHPVPLEGLPAVFMAAVFLLLSTAAAAAVLQSLGARPIWYRSLLLANIVLPVFHWLLF